MTPEEIKRNAPEGATHYMFNDGFIYYYKLVDDFLYFWSYYGNSYGIVNERINGKFHIGDRYENLKPL